MIRALNALMIMLVFSATVITIILAILQRGDKQAFITLLIASVFFFTYIITSRFGNQPINNAIMGVETARQVQDMIITISQTNKSVLATIIGLITVLLGATGSIVLILLWVSYSSMILFYGAEFTRAYADYFTGKVSPTEVAVKITDKADAKH